MSHFRLVLTNDIFGSFFAEQTSWGQLAGGDALVRTIDRLKADAAAAAWIDAGDFSGGGPLAPATGGVLGWEAAAALPIDAAVPGNHEFDFGDDAVAAWAPRLPFPLVAADLSDRSQMPAAIANAVVPCWTLSAPGGDSLAVLGLTFGSRRGLSVYDTHADIEQAIHQAREWSRVLRPDIDHIVAVVHDGVDDPPPGKPADDYQLARMAELCRGLLGFVDAVAGGHTLNRYIGKLAGMPFIQPWALGYEAGVLDIEDGKVTARSALIRPQAIPTSGEAGWKGPGAELAAKLRATIVGETRTPLITSRTAANTLGLAVAAGVRFLTGADVAFVTHEDTAAGQLAIDGTMNWIPAGPVSEAQVLRALPWAESDRGDGTWAAELTPTEVATVARALLTATGLPFAATKADTCQVNDESTGEPLPGGLTVVNSNYLRTAQRALSREIEWTRTGTGLRDGLRHALQHPINLLG